MNATLDVIVGILGGIFVMLCLIWVVLMTVVVPLLQKIARGDQSR